MIVKIEKQEFDRLQAIEAAALAFKELVERTGTAPAIVRLLNKAGRKGR